MTDTKNHSGETGSLEGRVFRPTSRAELGEAIELAFDYRGDVTLELSSGIQLTGYVFNRTVNGPDSFLEMFPSGRADAIRVPYDEVRSVAFSGEDTASGTSWEAWVAKKESERRAEAARVAAEAKARGHL
jgi:hypothetical protein